jgi:hypothetical protein
MIILTLEILKIIKCMVKVLVTIKMEINILVFGNMIKRMDKAFIIFKMEIDMMVNGNKIK